MSLLLEAMRKAGKDQPAGPDAAAPELALAEMAPASKPAREPAQEAGARLFNAKIAPPRGRLQLGIIPIALLGGGLIAAAGGLYVWYQITPRPLAARPAAPAATPRPQPAPAPAALPAAPTAAAPLPSDSAAELDPAPDVAPTPQEPRIRIDRGQESSRVDPLLASAYQAYGTGDLASAQRQYAAVLQQDRNNRDALLGLAGIAQQHGEDTLAAQYYARLLELDPRDPEAQAGLAGLGLGDNPGEESRLKMLLAQQPQSAALHFALGNLYADQQRWPEAQQAYFNACSLQPDSADYAFNLAVSLDHIGQAQAAAQYYRRALQLDQAGGAGFDRKQAQQRLDALKAP